MMMMMMMMMIIIITVIVIILHCMTYMVLYYIVGSASCKGHSSFWVQDPKAHTVQDRLVRGAEKKAVKAERCLKRCSTGRFGSQKAAGEENISEF